MSLYKQTQGVAGRQGVKPPGLVTGVNPAVSNRLVGSTLSDPNPSANLVSVGGEGDEHVNNHIVVKAAELLCSFFVIFHRFHFQLPGISVRIFPG